MKPNVKDGLFEIIVEYKLHIVFNEKIPFAHSKLVTKVQKVIRSTNNVMQA